MKGDNTLKYRTRRESFKWFSIIGLIVGIYAGIVFILKCMETSLDISMVLLSATLCIFGIGVWGYCWAFEIKKKLFYKNGKKYDGNIISAEELLNGRGDNTYYLVIEFSDGHKKMLRKTKGYVGNPNNRLINKSCSIYEWKGKYLEGDFHVSEQGVYNVNTIPITKHNLFKKKDKKYV